MDGLETWDRLVESAIRAAKERTPSEERPFGLCPLRLNETPTVTYLPKRNRTIDRIPLELRSVLRGLIQGTSPWPLFLFGSVGSGKTMAALCVLDYAGGDYYTAARLNESVLQSREGQLTVRGESGPTTIWPDKFWRLIEKSKLVVVDEIGCRDRATDFQYETLQRVIDDREGSPAIFISNLASAKLAEIYDDRIVSRLCRGTVLELSGKDQRL